MSRRKRQKADIAALPPTTPNAEPPEAATPRSTPKWLLPAMCAALVLMTFAVFGAALSFGFVDYDDPVYVYDAPQIKSGLTAAGVKWAFTQTHAGNWHPLTSISHMLDCEMYGLRASRHHLTNLVLHAATAVLLFLVLRSMTGTLWRSAVVAAVFAIHPLRVESVVWISERKDVLSGLLFMLTLAAYLRYARAPGLSRYAVVAVAFACALMAKQTVVTLPFVLLLVDFWPLRRFGTVATTQLRPTLTRAILEKIPLLFLSAGASAATVLAQRVTIATVEGLPFVWRLENAIVTCVIYLWQMIWPANLAAFYPHPNGTVPLWLVASTAAFVLVVSAAAFMRREKLPELFTGWFWYLVLLVPVIGIVQVGGQAHADRYTYLPHIGIYVAAVWLLARVLGTSRIHRAVAVAAAGVAIAALMWLARTQTTFWRDSETLWRRALAVTSGNEVAHNGLGWVLLGRGQLDEAIAHFEAATRAHPSYVEAQNNLAAALTKKGRFADAIERLEKLLATQPHQTDARYNLGNAYVASGRLDEAIAEYERTLAANPRHSGARYNLGNVYLQRGQFDAAIREFQNALALRPDYAAGYYNIGNALFEKGDAAQAIANYEKALHLQPDNAEAHNNIGLAHTIRAQPREAVHHWQRALALRPDFADAQNNLAWVLATCPDAGVRNGQEAIDLALRANQLSGGKSARVLRTLAAAYAEAGRFSEATDAARAGVSVASAQSDYALAQTLRNDIASFQANVPIRYSTDGGR